MFSPPEDEFCIICWVNLSNLAQGLDPPVEINIHFTLRGRIASANSSAVGLRWASGDVWWDRLADLGRTPGLASAVLGQGVRSVF